MVNNLNQPVNHMRFEVCPSRLSLCNVIQIDRKRGNAELLSQLEDQDIARVRGYQEVCVFYIKRIYYLFFISSPGKPVIHISVTSPFLLSNKL